MAEVKIQAESRTEFGKGAARRIRRADKVPAVLYGRGTDPVHITLPGHDIMLALKNSNALLSIDVGGKSQLAIPKDVQRDPIKGFVEHVDLLVVKRGEKVVVEIPVIVHGEPGPDAMVVTEHPTVSVEAEATHIPEAIEVDIQGAEVGTQIHAGDLKLPSGSTLHLDDDVMVVNVVNQPTEEQLEEELAGAEAEVGIEREEHQEVAEEEAAAPNEGGGADQRSSEEE